MICVRYADDSVVGFERFFFSSRRRHTRCSRDWSSDVCSSDLGWSLGPVLAFYACFTGALLSKGPQALAALAAAGVAVAFTDGTAMLRRLRPVLGSVLAFGVDRKSTRLNSSHGYISYAVFCLKQKTN